MPELRFEIGWPDGTRETCYSPSRAIARFLQPERSYALADFLEQARLGLAAASERVRERYGAPCPRAAAQFAQLEAAAVRYAQREEARVSVGAFIESLAVAPR